MGGGLREVAMIQRLLHSRLFAPIGYDWLRHGSPHPRVLVEVLDFFDAERRDIGALETAFGLGVSGGHAIGACGRRTPKLIHIAGVAAIAGAQDLVAIFIRADGIIILILIVCVLILVIFIDIFVLFFRDIFLVSRAGERESFVLCGRRERDTLFVDHWFHVFTPADEPSSPFIGG
jgi:hypothetical protein